MNQPDGVQNFPPIYTTGNMTQFNSHPPSSLHGQTNSYYQYPAQQQTLSQMPSFSMSPPGTAINLPPVRPAQPVLGTVYPVQASMGFKRLLAEMKLRQFDTIRFAAYRTASKLRYIQQRTLFRFMELSRVVETFREFGLHQLNDPNASLDYAGTARILARIYSQLSGPTTDVQTKSCSKTTPSFDPNVLRAASEILLSFLIYALDVCATARLTVNSLKIALSTLTNAKPSDKFRYHFTLLSDPSGALIQGKFETYLQDLLRLPISVFEGPNFFYTPQAAQAMLSGRSKNILIEDFLERMLADPGPQLLVWLTIFHRLAAVENIRHNVRCEGCKREPLFGLRYKCTRCQHYNLCQDCFWTGVTTEPHTNAHDVKEYSSASKSHSRQFGHSLRKSFQLGRFTGSGPQAPGNVTPSQTVSDRSNGAHLNKRPPLGSIFEWNSAPACFDATNVTRNGSMQTYAGVNPHTEIVSNVPIGAVQSSMSLSYRPQLPTTSIRSPLPHRRLQQLNPLFLSPATHPSFGNQPVAKASNMQYTTSPIMPPGSALPLPPNPNPQMMTGVREFDNTLAAGQPVSHYGFAVTTAPDAQQAMLVSKCSPLSMAVPGVVGSVGTRPGANESLSGVQSEPWSARIPERPQMAPAGPGQPMPSVMFTSSGNVGRNLDFQCREEHELIARYAAQLAAASAFNTEFEKFGDLPDSPQTQQQLIAELQAKNRKILREIERLRIEQQKQAAVIAAAGAPKSGIAKDLDLQHERALSPKTISQFNSQDEVQVVGENPKLVSELNVLRQRKDDLEARMNNLQRNRTELTLQLEALVRLLSLSGGMTTVAQQTAGLRLLSPDTTTPNKSLRSMLPGTPLADIRLGHQSRTGTVRPEYPPRRSSSLCHGSTDRGGKGPQLASSSVMDSKHEHKRYVRNLSLTTWEDMKPTDRPATAADLLRKNLLSPISDLITESSLTRSPFNPEPSTRGTISTSTFSDRPENRSANLVISSTSSSNHNTTSVGSKFPHSNLNKSQLLRKPNNLTDKTHVSHYTDSGSEAYLYSDPEVGTSSGLASLTRGGVSQSWRAQKLLPSDRSPVPQCSDNYEYPGLLHSVSVLNGSDRSRHDSNNPTEFLTESKG